MSDEEYFRIGGFDFGIEETSRQFRYLADGRLVAEVCGSKQVMAELLETDHFWSWVLYPPRFYLYGVNFSVDAEGAITTDTSFEVEGQGEIGIYAIAHRAIGPYVLTMTDGLVTASGMVHGLGEEPDGLAFDVAFHIPPGTKAALGLKPG